MILIDYQLHKATFLCMNVSLRVIYSVVCIFQFTPCREILVDIKEFEGIYNKTVALIQTSPFICNLSLSFRPEIRS